LTCQCSLPKSQHEEKAVFNYHTYSEKKNSPLEWNPKICTEPGELTDAYGSIEFDNYAGMFVSKYIRAFHRTDMDLISSLLFETWKCKIPQLIISVTGGARLNVNPKIRDVFCNGVVKAAYSTNAWITTGGSYTGIMKYIGEAVHRNINSLNVEKRLILLGIANWTTVAKRESLILTDSCQQPVEYNLKDFQAKEGIKAERLDPNHSHFILVDNSNENEFGGEIDFRARLEDHLRKTVKIGDYGELPVVMVVFEGGPNTARAVIESVRKRIPCIFINRTGRMANILSFIYETVEEAEIQKKAKLISKEKNKKEHASLDKE